MRPGAGFRVPLETECRPVGERDALQGPIEQRAVRGLDVVGQSRLIDRETVILARDHDLAGLDILHRMIRSVVAKLHLFGFRPGSKRQELVTETNPEDGNALIAAIA